MEQSQDGEILAVNGRIEDKEGIHFIEPASRKTLGSFYTDTSTNQWVFTENNSTIIALFQSESYSWPREENDKIVYYNWQENSMTKLIFPPALEMYLGDRAFLISDFVYGAESSLEFGCD